MPDTCLIRPDTLWGKRSAIHGEKAAVALPQHLRHNQAEAEGVEVRVVLLVELVRRGGVVVDLEVISRGDHRVRLRLGGDHAPTV